jgi:hypothetical protein
MISLIAAAAWMKVANILLVEATFAIGDISFGAVEFGSKRSI